MFIIYKYNSGIVIRKWKSVLAGDRCSLQLYLLANSIRVHNEQKSGNFVTDEMQTEYQCFWVILLKRH